MATRRRPPPKKQPSPPQPPDESSEDEEEELESDSGKEPKERDGKQSQSKPSDDDDSDDGDESGEEESESEPEQPAPNVPHSAAVASTVPAPASPAAASDDDEDDEVDESGEADSETEEEQPVPDRPASRAATTGKPSSDNSLPESGRYAATPPKTTTGEAAKKLFQRIWSDEDQTTLLKGMVDYIATQGKDPIANIEGFWLFIRKKLSFPVTEWQLMRKIRAVKDKYRNNQKKGRAFSKSYDAEVFELSKKVWGAGGKSMEMENGGGKKRMSNKLGEEAEAEAVENCANDEVVDDWLEWENETVTLSMGHIDWSEELARVEIKSMAASERKLMMQSWKKVKREEISSLAHRRSLEFDSMKTIFRCP